MAGEQGGPAVPVQVVSGGSAGVVAQPVVGYTTPPPQGVAGMPDVAIVEATASDIAAGRARIGAGAPLAVYVRPSPQRGPVGGAPLLVYVVSGSLGTATNAIRDTADQPIYDTANQLIYPPGNTEMGFTLSDTSSQLVFDTYGRVVYGLTGA